MDYAQKRRPGDELQAFYIFDGLIED